MDQIHLIQNRILMAVYVLRKIMKRQEQALRLLVDNVDDVMTFQL